MEKETLIKMQAIANTIATQIGKLRSIERCITERDVDNYCQTLCALITAYDSIIVITKEKEEKGGKPNE